MRRLTLLALVTLLGCGSAGSPGPTDTGGGAGGGSTTQSSSFCCSINRVSYDCPDNASVERCGNIDNPDPSSCTRRSAPCR